MFILGLCGVQPEVIAAFGLQRRPTAVAVSDDSRKMAVLTPEWRVMVFHIHLKKAQLDRTFLLDEPGAALALSSDGSLLAVAQPQGIEFMPLAEARGAAVRRKLACEPVSHLKFAEDGAYLLGTNTRSTETTSTIINAPSHTSAHIAGEDSEANTAEIWLSQPLFPSSFGKTTHASPVPGDDSCIVAYDVPAETFGFLDFQKMKFVKSIVKTDADVVALATSTPSITFDACLVALPVSGQGVQVASLPAERLATSHQRNPSAPQMYTFQGQGDISDQHHQRWIELGEKGFAAQWTTVRSGAGVLTRERLVIASSTHVIGKRRESAIEDIRDTGLIHFLDFSFCPDVPETQETMLDLSNFNVDPLEEGTTEDDIELALARQITSGRANDRPQNAPLVRSVTSGKKRSQRRPSLEKIDPEAASGPEELMSPEEQHLDAPYLPSEPRPHGTLQRQRTATQTRAERPRSMPLDPRPRMRDPSGRGEIPDESDGDGWVPPPPEYQKDTNEELPEVLRETLRAPAIPARSPARKSASTPDLKSTSTPDLVLNQSQPHITHTAGASGAPVPESRPRPRRIRTFVENARQSIFGLHGLRHSSKGPAELMHIDGATDIPPSQLDSQSSTKRSSESAPSDSVPTPAQPHPVNPHRHSVLERPLSVYTQLRPTNARSVSQPVERSSPAFASIPFPSGTVDSPSTPNPAQVASLHRRQTSGSISSLRSDTSGPPRAAMGAHRRGTNTMSPWASSLMLNTVDEDGQASRPTASYAGGTPGSSRPMSIIMNGPGPSGVNSSGPGTPLTPANGRATAQVQESNKENGPPARLEEASIDESRSSTSRPDTASTSKRRRSFMPNSRLASIPSVGSLLSGTKGGRSSSKSSATGVQRSGSRRLERNGSVRKMGNATEKEGLRKRLGRWRENLMKNLESV